MRQLGREGGLTMATYDNDRHIDLHEGIGYDDKPWPRVRRFGRIVRRLLIAAVVVAAAYLVAHVAGRI
jgi:hypothetical protein